MTPFIFLAAVSLVLSLSLTPLSREIFRKLKIVDRPDQGRKLHATPTPRAGGPPILMAYFGAIALALVVLPQRNRLAIHHTPTFYWLVPAVMLIFFVGLLDDIRGMAPHVKLAFQVLAASLACWGGVRIETINNHPVSAWWAIPLTILWLCACANAVNLIDGLDGLAAGVSLFATLTAMVVAVLQDNTGLVLATVPLAGALLGFLRYNFSPASIFLGDSGSLTIGFLLGCFGVIWCQKMATLTGLMAPLISLSVPLVDVSISVARRFLANRGIFSPDRGHIHHRLLARGFAPRTATLLLYAACLATAVLAVSLSFVDWTRGIWLLLLGFTPAVVAIWKLRFVEFEVVRQLIFTGQFRRAVEAELGLSALRDECRSTRTVDDYWRMITEAGASENIQSVELLLPANHFQKTFFAALEEELWTVEVNLGAGLLLRVRGCSAQGEPQSCKALLRLLQIASWVRTFIVVGAEETHVTARALTASKA